MGSVVFLVMIGLSWGTKPFVFPSAARSKRETVGALCWRGSCHYRCRSALAVRSGTRAFEARGLYRETVISLTQGEPDSQLSPLKIGFLSPEIRIRLSPLHRGSIRKTCRPLRPREARIADLVVISVTFDLSGPAATLIPHQGGFPLGVCLSASQALSQLQVSCI